MGGSIHKKLEFESIRKESLNFDDQNYNNNSLIPKQSIESSGSYQQKLNNLAESYQIRNQPKYDEKGGADDHEQLDQNAGATSISLAKLVLTEEDESAHNSRDYMSMSAHKE